MSEEVESPSPRIEIDRSVSVCYGPGTSLSIIAVCGVVWDGMRNVCDGCIGDQISLNPPQDNSDQNNYSAHTCDICSHDYIQGPESDPRSTS